MPVSSVSPGSTLVLALDQGGHASRALAIDACGDVVSHAAVDIAVMKPGPDRVEHDPEEVVRSLETSISRVLDDLGPRAADVCAAGLATQRSSVVCWDRETGAALSPVLSWQDRRGADLVASLAEHASDVRGRTGLVLSPHYGGSKLRWCLDHLEPVRNAAAARRLAWGPLASFLLFRLLEERPHIVDPANAARTQLWNLRNGAWDPELLKLHGIRGDALPESVPSRHRAGHLKRGPESTVGRIPLTVTTGDQSAALFADGPPPPGVVSVNVGTGAFLQRVVGTAPVDAPGLLTSVAWQDDRAPLYVLEGTVNGAGAALTEMGRALGFDSTEDAIAAAGTANRSGNVPLFLNGVSGLGAPYWRSHFRSRFVGEGGTAARMAAVLESIAFLLAVNLDCMADTVGRAPRLVLTGGVASLDAFCQNLADVSRVLVERSVAREATARGLAWLIADDPPDWRDAEPDAIFTPGATPVLADRFARWRAAMDSALNDV